MANTALMPMPMQQFFSAVGVPLAGGKIFSYAAGTTTPLATYTNSSGSAANTNPVILDSGGFANIWLLAETYKIVAQDSAGVEQWSQDNVSAVSIAELQENNSFDSIAVSGNATIGGDLTVSGATTTASLDVTGAATIEGVLNAVTAAISGNATIEGTLDVTGAVEITGDITAAGDLAVAGDETVTGDLTVTGAANLNGAVNIGAVTLAAYILASVVGGALPGDLIVTDSSTSGNWVIFTFGGTADTKVKIALGAGGGVSNGGAITLPSGFNTTNLFIAPSIGSVATTPGNQLDQFSVSCTAGVISVAASDNSGHNFTPTANWFGVAWLTGQ